MNWPQGPPICLDERDLVKDFPPASESPSTEYVPDFRHSRGAKCNEYLIGDGSDYRGCQTRTRRGYVCQKWSAQRPRTPHSGLTSPGDHNYCRNPNGSPNSQTTIWCYIHNQLYPDSDAEDLAWEYCDPVDYDYAASGGFKPWSVSHFDTVASCHTQDDKHDCGSPTASSGWHTLADRCVVEAIVTTPGTNTDWTLHTEAEMKNLPKVTSPRSTDPYLKVTHGVGSGGCGVQALFYCEFMNVITI